MRTVVPFLVVCGGIVAIASLAFFGCGPSTPGTASPSGTSTSPGVSTVRAQSAKYSNGVLELYDYFPRPVTDLPLPGATAKSMTAHLQNGSEQDVWVRYGEDDPCVIDSFGNKILVGDTPAVALYDVFKDRELQHSLCDGESYTEYSGEYGLTDCDKRDKGAYGKRLNNRAIAVPGKVDRKTGAYSPCPPEKPCFTLACTTGVIAKCVHWGYPPWANKYTNRNITPDVVDLSEYYQSCIHAARAHYCTSGPSFTCEATLIDMFDDIGIQLEQPDDRTIESGWNKNGLTCFDHARYDRSSPDCKDPAKPCPSGVMGKPARSCGGDTWPNADPEMARTKLKESYARIGVRSQVQDADGCVSDEKMCPEKPPVAPKPPPAVAPVTPASGHKP